jgi:carboxypeptidase C (cathepsin A)
VRQLSELIGIGQTTLDGWSLNVAAATDLGTPAFLVTLLKDRGLALGAYDGRAAGDLAATMSLNVDLKVLSANGYYDSVTPFHQTTLDLGAMPVTDAGIRNNLTVRYYPSGHMIYLDGNSRTALKADLAQMYDSTTADHAATAWVRALQRRSSP